MGNETKTKDNIPYINNSDLRIQYEIFGKGKLNNIILPFSAFGFPAVATLKQVTRDKKLFYKIQLEFFMCPTKSLFGKDRDYRYYPLLTSIGYSCKNDFGPDEEPIRIDENDNGWYELEYKNGVELFLIKNFIKMKFGNTYRKPIKSVMYFKSRYDNKYDDIYTILTMLDIIIGNMHSYIDDIHYKCSNLYYKEDSSDIIMKSVMFIYGVIDSEVSIVEKCIDIDISYSDDYKHIIIEIAEGDFEFKKEFKLFDITAYIFIFSVLIQIAFKQEDTENITLSKGGN